MPFRPSRRVLTALTAAALMTGGGLATDPVSAASGRTRTVSPGVDLTVTLASLRAGDTLLLAPGTYDSHTVRPVVHQGTAAAPITVRAADPANRPLIRGHLKLWGASYWHVSGLRIQTVDRLEDGLTMAGGRGWSVLGSEIWGARSTGAYSNVAIAYDNSPSRTGAPRDFVFANNCVHDAANVTSRPAPTDHNIYVNFAGTPRSGGRITRNVIFGAPHGAGIKLGNGGAPRARGPWGVTVTDNTIADGGYQVLMHGDVRRNVVVGNLFWHAKQMFKKLPKTTSIYAHDVVGPGNVFAHNYAYASSMVAYGKNMRSTVDNGIRPNPGITQVGSCDGYRPTQLRATAYGRYGSNRWPRW